MNQFVNWINWEKGIVGRTIGQTKYEQNQISKLVTQFQIKRPTYTPRAHDQLGHNNIFSVRQFFTTNRPRGNMINSGNSCLSNANV